MGASARHCSSLIPEIQTNSTLCGLINMFLAWFRSPVCRREWLLAGSAAAEECHRRSAALLPLASWLILWTLLLLLCTSLAAEQTHPTHYPLIEQQGESTGENEEVKWSRPLGLTVMGYARNKGGGGRGCAWVIVPKATGPLTSQWPRQTRKANPPEASFNANGWGRRRSTTQEAVQHISEEPGGKKPGGVSEFWNEKPGVCAPVCPCVSVWQTLRVIAVAGWRTGSEAGRRHSQARLQGTQS